MKKAYVLSVFLSILLSQTSSAQQQRSTTKPIKMPRAYQGRLYNFTNHFTYHNSSAFCLKSKEYDIYPMSVDNSGIIRYWRKPNWFDMRISIDKAYWVPQSDFYAISAGNLYKSTNYGENWRPIDFGLPAKVKEIVISPNARRLCAITSDLVLTSHDAGFTWLAAKNFIFSVSAKIIFHPNNNDISVGISETHVSVSKDGAITWESVATSASSFIDIAFANDSTFCTLEYDGTIKTFDVNKLKLVSTTKSQVVDAFGFCVLRKYFLVFSDKMMLLDKNKPVWSDSLTSKVVLGSALSDSNAIVVDNTGRITIYNLTGGKKTVNYGITDYSKISSLQYFKESNTIIAGYDNTEIPNSINIRNYCRLVDGRVELKLHPNDITNYKYQREFPAAQIDKSGFALSFDNGQKWTLRSARTWCPVGNRVYFVTDKGFDVFDPVKRSFTLLQNDYAKKIKTLYYHAPDNSLWAIADLEVTWTGGRASGNELSKSVDGGRTFKTVVRGDELERALVFNFSGFALTNNQIYLLIKAYDEYRLYFSADGGWHWDYQVFRKIGYQETSRSVASVALLSSKYCIYLSGTGSLNVDVLRLEDNKRFNFTTSATYYYKDRYCTPHCPARFPSVAVDDSSNLLILGAGGDMWESDRFIRSVVDIFDLTTGKMLYSVKGNTELIYQEGIIPLKCVSAYFTNDSVIIGSFGEPYIIPVTSNTIDEESTISGKDQGERKDSGNDSSFVILYVQGKEADKMHLRIIVLKTFPEAEDIISRLNNGESFSKLAVEKSIHHSNTKGGDIGKFSLSDLSKEFQTALKNLQKGNYTYIIQLKGQ